VLAKPPTKHTGSLLGRLGRLYQPLTQAGTARPPHPWASPAFDTMTLGLPAIYGGEYVPPSPRAYEIGTGPLLSAAGVGVRFCSFFSACLVPRLV